MNGIARHWMRAAVIVLACAGAAAALLYLAAGGPAGAQEEWKTLSGEPLWDQAGVYERQNCWREACNALDKYLGNSVGSAGFSPSPGGGVGSAGFSPSPGAALSPERLIEARFRLARAEFQASRSTNDFGRFDTLLADFETSHTAETARIQTLRQLWTEAPLTKDDWAEGERRLKWYLENYPNAPEVVLVKKDLARKKWQDGDQDGAVADLKDILARNAGNTFLAPVAGALGDCECERGGYEAQAAALEGFLKDHAEDYPGLAPLHLALGMAYLNLGRPAEVGAQMAYVIEHDFYGGHAHEAVKASAQALDKMGLARDGLASLEEVVRRYADTMPRFEFVIQERADFQLRLDGPDAAIASLKAHITAHPALVTVGDAVYVLSRVIMKAQGPAAAITEMERLAAAHPGFYAGRHAQSLLAELAAYNGDPASAAKYCREFVEKHPDSPALESVLNMECFHLYRAGRFEEAEKAAEARVLAFKAPAGKDVMPAYVLSATLFRKGWNLRFGGRAEEAEKTLAYAQDVFNIHLQLAGDEYITYTMELCALRRDNDKWKELVTRYLATHPESTSPEETAYRDVVLCNHVMLLLDHDGSPEAVSEAAKTLDEMRGRQETLAANSMEGIGDYDPLMWPRLLELRIEAAKKMNDPATAKACLLELRDRIPRTAERVEIARRLWWEFPRHGVDFPAGIEAP